MADDRIEKLNQQSAIISYNLMSGEKEERKSTK